MIKSIILSFINSSGYPILEAYRIFYDDGKNEVIRMVKEKLKLSQNQRENLSQFYRKHIPSNIGYVEFDDNGFMRTFNNYITVLDPLGLGRVDVEE